MAASFILAPALQHITILDREADGVAGILRTLEPCERDFIATIGELRILLPPEFTDELQKLLGQHVVVMHCDDQYLLKEVR